MSAEERTLLRWVRIVILRVRLCRALVAGSAAAFAACVAAILPLAAQLLGLDISWRFSGTELGLVGSIFVGLASLVAVLAPVGTVRIVSVADRRSQLDGALVTAVESIGTEEPIGRLLVRSTARKLETLATGRAVPLAGPGAIAAFASVALLLLAAVPVAGTSSGGELEVAMDSDEAVLSARLRTAATTIVRDAGIPAAERSALARQVLDAEAGLLRGTVTTEEAGRTLASLTDRLGDRYSRFATAQPGSVGPAAAEERAGVPGDRPDDAEGRHGSRFTDAPGVGISTASGGPGAGTGRAGPAAPGGWKDAASRTDAAAEWALPLAPRARTPVRAGARGPGSDGEPSANVDVVSTELRPVEHVLTREERALVKAYMDRLRHLTRDDPATSGR